jgi:hypothetical protein
VGVVVFPLIRPSFALCLVVSLESFDTGKSVLLAFAFLFGIIGVTGQLPALIQQGGVIRLDF